MCAAKTPVRLLLAAMLACSSLLNAQDLAPEALYEKLLPSILTLKVETKSGEKYVGAAFLALRPGVAITAWHVIHDATKVTARYADGAAFEISGFLDKDETKDIALIPVPVSPRPLVSIATLPPRIGSRAYVIGSPKGYEFSISDGLFSQVQKVDGFDQYQVSCPFSPGNSGGPILNASGAVMGVAAWTRNGAQNLNFATPATEALNLNPGASVKKWKSQPFRRTAQASTDVKKKSGPEDNAAAVSQFKKTMQKAAGKEVTIVVMQDGHQERFTFTMPSNLTE